jgi:hypothetical protein
MKITESQIKNIAVAVGVVSAATAIIVYLDNKKWRNMNADVVKLDREIKILQLEKLKKQA